MIAVIEGDDGWFAGGVTRDLYGILNRFRATIEENGFLGEISRRDFDDTLGKRHVWLVHHDAKAGMHKFRGLLGDGLHHLRTAMTDVHDTDAPGKIDIAIAIDIFDHGPFGLFSKYGHGRSNASRYKLLAARQQFA